jgi:hypothetical protein
MGAGRRLNPGLRIIAYDEHGMHVEIHNPCQLSVMIECSECSGSGNANGNTPSQRMRLMIEDVDGLIREIWAAQPMLRAKRNVILNRLHRIRHNLEILRNAA